MSWVYEYTEDEGGDEEKKRDRFLKEKTMQEKMKYDREKTSLIERNKDRRIHQDQALERRKQEQEKRLAEIKEQTSLRIKELEMHARGADRSHEIALLAENLKKELQILEQEHRNQIALINQQQAHESTLLDKKHSAEYEKQVLGYQHEIRMKEEERISLSHQLEEQHRKDKRDILLHILKYKAEAKIDVDKARELAQINKETSSQEDIENFFYKKKKAWDEEI